MIQDESPAEWRARVKTLDLEEEWCLALHGNHDEHRCHLKPGHGNLRDDRILHECYCGVRW